MKLHGYCRIGVTEKKNALDELLPIVYDDALTRRTQIPPTNTPRRFRLPPLFTKPTGNSPDSTPVDWENRGQFFRDCRAGDATNFGRSRPQPPCKSATDIKIVLTMLTRCPSRLDESLIDLDIALKGNAEFDELQSKIV